MKPLRNIIPSIENYIHFLFEPMKILFNIINLGFIILIQQQYSHDDFEVLKCIWSKLKCPLTAQYNMDFKDSIKLFMPQWFFTFITH